MLRVLPTLVNFAIILFTAFRTINTRYFSPLDINLSLIALIFSVIVELILIKRKR